jgi:hypothetical protein
MSETLISTFVHFLLLRQKKTNQKKGRLKKMLPNARAGTPPLFWEANAPVLLKTNQS